MGWRAVVRHGTKWVLTLGAAALVATWVCTRPESPKRYLLMHHCAAGVRDGAVALAWVPQAAIDELVQKVAGLPRLPAGEAGEEILRGYRANLEDSAARELKTVVIAVDSTEYYYGRRPPSRLWWWSPVVSTHLKVRAFAFPIWMPLAAAAFPAMILWWPQVRSLRSIFRKPKGICRKCGYDLKGLAAGAVCPECGTAPR